jgi:hypothetical protein
MLTDQEQLEIARKVQQIWDDVDKLWILREVLFMIDQQLNSAEYEFSPREVRIQILLDYYRESNQKCLDNLRSLTAQVDGRLIKDLPEMD